MTEFSRRCILALLPLVLLLTDYRSHGKVSREASVAFVRFSHFSAPVRIRGDLEYPGIYKFSDGERLSTAIKMTAPKVWARSADRKEIQTLLSPGDVVEILPPKQNSPGFLLDKMSVRERLLLGIPLHPDELNSGEWQLLPGIGPGIAHAIIEDRQLNGAFGTIYNLARVPGIGEKKVQSLISYF